MKDEQERRQDIMKNITSLYELTFPLMERSHSFYELASEMLINLALTIHTHNHDHSPNSEERDHSSFLKKVEYVLDTYQEDNKNED